MTLLEKVKTWRSNADSVGASQNIPVGLLQAQLKDAANIVEGFTKLKNFEGVPMKVLIDYLTVALIDELNIDHLIKDDFDAQMFRSKVDNALFRAKMQTEGGKWYDELAES